MHLLLLFDTSYKIRLDGQQSESNTFLRSIKHVSSLLFSLRYLHNTVLSLNIWSEVREPAENPICSPLIVLFLGTLLI